MKAKGSVDIRFFKKNWGFFYCGLLDCSSLLASVVANIRDQSMEVESEKSVKPTNLIEKAKEEIQAFIHHENSPRIHHKETHGRRDDIDETTPIDEIKGPSILQRAKEELEALVETIHPKKESSDYVPSKVKEEGGFGASIGRGLEKVCSPDKACGIGASIGKGLEKVCSPRGSTKKD